MCNKKINLIYFFKVGSAISKLEMKHIKAIQWSKKILSILSGKALLCQRDKRADGSHLLTRATKCKSWHQVR